VPLTHSFYATLTLRDARNLQLGAIGPRCCEPSQILSDGGQKKLILGPWTAQSKPTELSDALQVRLSTCASAGAGFNCEKPDLVLNELPH
jgi:hypothetical protein